jgi:hypothetical protein
MWIQSAFEQAGIRFLDNYATGEIVPLLEKNASKSCETAPRLINGGTQVTSGRRPCQVATNLEINP